MHDGLEFDWDEGNIGHIARHLVTPEEAEQAIRNDPVDLGAQTVEGEERFLSLGITSRARLLVVATTMRGPGFGWLRRMAETGPRVIPVFRSEADEATWWDSHQALIEERFLQAAAAGTLGHGRVAKRAVVARTSGASPTLTLRVPETDISRARALAARKGLRYQTYLRMLIHEGLEREEQRA